MTAQRLLYLKIRSEDKVHPLFVTPAVQAGPVGWAAQDVACRPVPQHAKIRCQVSWQPAVIIDSWDGYVRNRWHLCHRQLLSVPEVPGLGNLFWRISSVSSELYSTMWPQYKYLHQFNPSHNNFTRRSSSSSKKKIGLKQVSNQNVFGLSFYIFSLSQRERDG